MPMCVRLTVGIDRLVSSWEDVPPMRRSLYPSPGSDGPLALAPDAVDLPLNEVDHPVLGGLKQRDRHPPADRPRGDQGRHRNVAMANIINLRDQGLRS